MSDKPTIFISHSHADHRLAARLQTLLEHVSGRGLSVSRSSEDGAIKSGENWRSWIDDKVMRCDVAIVLLTPSSFRGHWVLWEAGAVTGVQYERLKETQIKSDDPLARRVRVVAFNVAREDLGPFANMQVRDGLGPAEMIPFVREILNEFAKNLDPDAVDAAKLELKETISAFVAGAKDDLRHTPIKADEGLIQEWLARLDNAKAKGDDRWIVSAKRWINIAFLGANNADAHTKGEVIDFRIHIRIAEAHQRLNEWAGVVEQFRLATRMSPNDLMILRQLGRAYREMNQLDAVETIMREMQDIDTDIFKKDREGIALRCGYFATKEMWDEVSRLLTNADSAVVWSDPYLANWQAIATMKARGGEASLPLFQRLRELMRRVGKGFWDDATLVNALLALNDSKEAEKKLEILGLGTKTKAEVDSATRFYDEILSTFAHDVDWRKAAGLTSTRAAARGEAV
jgi:TIR domain